MEPFVIRRWSILLIFKKLMRRNAPRPTLLGVKFGLLGIHLSHQFLDPINRNQISKCAAG